MNRTQITSISSSTATMALHCQLILASILALLLFSGGVMANSIQLKPKLEDRSTSTHYSKVEIRNLGFEIAKELRCPTSPNQNLFDSQSRIASELKGQIFLMLEQGKSKQAIIDFMVQRYGEKMRYLPSLNSGTVFLWLAPLLLVLMAIGGVYFFIRPKLIVSPRATSSPLIPTTGQKE
jgi:cytochrome c-type biogenesis protein CcmH/NrfF